MSSSNLVRVAFIEETQYGVTPVSGNFQTARFTSEKLSGSPGTTESAQIRTDRQSSGQIVTSLTLGGDLNFELAKELALETFMQSAMYNTWSVLAMITADITIDPTAMTLTRAAGSFITDGIVVGDYIGLGGFTNAVNNTNIMAAVVTATVITFVGPTNSPLVAETGTANTLKRGDKLSIGIQKHSFSMEKAFLDLTTKAILYRGMIVSQMSLDIAFGGLITGSFSFSGNGYQTVSTSSAFMTNTRTITAPATTSTLNGSIDMPFVASSAIGSLGAAGLDIKSLSLKLDNGLSAQNVIGNIAPRDYSAGTAKIDVSLDCYLKDPAWALLANKLAQTPFALGFMVRNTGGGYGFYISALQVSFDDPSSAGANQDILLQMSGSARVGLNGESALTIYRLT